MLNFCTHSDKNYLAKGIALYHSLKKNNDKITLWYLCTDVETFEILMTLDLPGLVPIDLRDLEKSDVQLRKSRNNPASQYGTQYSQFCWTLTPYFIWWLLKNKIGSRKELIYCDADLYFYHSAKAIQEQCDGDSVGIHQHRFTSYDVNTNPVGEFNVGCLYFRNNTIGREISKFWKDLLLDPNNKYYNQYGTCGDQKYLDLFIPLFGHHINVFDHDDSGIAHGAPWNFDLYKYDGIDKTIVEFKGRTQKLIFNHFSHFTHDFDANTWSSSDHGEWEPDNRDATVKQFYLEYWEHLKAANEQIKTLQEHE